MCKITANNAKAVAKKTAKTIYNINISWFRLVGVILVFAKVFEIGTVATWSWWLVLLPFYIGFVIVLCVLSIIAAVLMIGGLVFGAHTLWEMYSSYKRRKAREKQEMWNSLSKK